MTATYIPTPSFWQTLAARARVLGESIGAGCAERFAYRRRLGVSNSTE